jgi:hypothetical protein
MNTMVSMMISQYWRGENEDNVNLNEKPWAGKNY